MASWEDEFDASKKGESKAFKFTGDYKVEPKGFSWEDAFSKPLEEPKKEPKFVPGIGGVVDPSKMNMSSLEGVKEYAKGGLSYLNNPVVRGIPAVKHLLPINEHHIRFMENHPNIEAGGNILGGLGTNMALSSVGANPNVSMPVYAGLQATVHAGKQFLDKLFEKDFKATPKELGDASMYGMLEGGATGAAGKLISPLAYGKFRPNPHMPEFANMYNQSVFNNAKSINQTVKSALDKGLAKYDILAGRGITPANLAPTVLGYLGGGSIGKELTTAALAGVAPHALRAWLTNNLMYPGSAGQKVLNTAITTAMDQPGARSMLDALMQKEIRIP